MNMRSPAHLLVIAALVVTTIMILPHGFGHAQEHELVLMARLKMADTDCGGDEPIRITYTLSNPTDQPITVLTWNTPLEGFNNDVFKIIRDGERVLYTGRIIKRGRPAAEDYVTIAPDDSETVTLDLAEAYDLHHVGDYHVQLAYDLLDTGLGSAKTLAENDVLRPLVVPANAVTFSLSEEREPKIEEGQPPEALGPAPVFTNCSADQQDQLKRALSSAQWIASVAVASVHNTPMTACPKARRYNTWFGSYTDARYQSVHDNTANIEEALSTKQMAFDCGCTQPCFAYVYPDRPYKIYLCNAFWNASMTGTDSKAGTLVHETSHFYVVAGTKDYRYGQAGCKTLAQNSPNKAVANADSYVYYSEDTPPIAMP